MTKYEDRKIELKNSLNLDDFRNFSGTNLKLSTVVVQVQVGGRGGLGKGKPDLCPVLSPAVINWQTYIFLWFNVFFRRQVCNEFRCIGNYVLKVKRAS